MWWNNATQGGAIYAEEGSRIALSGIAGWSNTAFVDGGFISCHMCHLLGT